MKDLKIGDLIHVPKVRTVVQLADLEVKEYRQLLGENFLVTQEVDLALRSILHPIARGEGQGFFIEGNFGAGKSHLLSFLYLLLTQEKTWSYLSLQDSLSHLSHIKEKEYLIITISLVEYSQEEYLEHIFLSALREVLGAEGDFSLSKEKEFRLELKRIVIRDHRSAFQKYLKEKEEKAVGFFEEGPLSLLEEVISYLQLPYRPRYERKEVFKTLLNLLAKKDGMVILIDELSEFLRSKPDGRQFNEDIRFLQYLGEFCNRHGSFVIATLQEEIEKTGGTTPEAFNKIKDRFPVRLQLTGTHIKELIGERLIKKKEGAQEVIGEIYSFYQSAFPHLKISKDQFIKIYPVHPLTISLLDNLKPLFSRQRGIVDFIHYRLRGNEDRQIEGMLQKPSTTLLTPDYIFDHFSHRIREMMETAPYYEKVYNYYRQEISKILSLEDQELGLNIIKLLILFRISPIECNYKVKEIADMLLYRITDLDAMVNYEYINDILEKLYRGGAYLAKEKKERKGDMYKIDLEADINLILRRRLEYFQKNLLPDDYRLFSLLGGEIRKVDLPLRDLLLEPRTTRSLTWQNTERKALLILTDLQKITRETLLDYYNELLEEELDFILLMGEAYKVKEASSWVKNSLFPKIKEEEGPSLVFWLPQELEEEEFRCKTLARLLLLIEYRQDFSSTGKEIRERLETEIEDSNEKLTAIFAKAYYQGTFINGTGRVLMEKGERRFLPFKDFFQRIGSLILSECYPRHVHIAPYQLHISNNMLKELEEEFLETGEIEVTRAAASTLNKTIDGYLKPMDLVKKKGKNLYLYLDPDKNPLLKEFFSLLEDERTSVDQIYKRLNRGPYGLTKRPFQILVVSLIYAGYITPYTDRNRLQLKGCLLLSFYRLKYVGAGEILSEDLQSILLESPLLPKRLKKQPFTLPLQQEIWQYLTQWKREMAEELENIKAKILIHEELVRPLHLEKIQEILKYREDLLQSILVTYRSQEGLEKFLNHCQRLLHIEKDLKNYKNLSTFFIQHLEEYRSIREYIEDPLLHIPSSPPYQIFRDSLEKIREAFRGSLFYEEGSFERVAETFHQFQKEYSTLYQEEHQRQVGEKRLRPFLRLKEGKGYILLSLFSQLKVVSVTHDMVKVNRLLSKATENLCQDSPSFYLDHRPLCSCSFQLGSSLELPSIKEVHSTIEKGLVEYVEALQNPPHLEKIKSYCKGMEEAREKRSAKPLLEILSLKRGPSFLSTLEGILSKGFIDRLNQILAGDVSIQERQLDVLIEKMEGRSFSPEDLMRLFQDWMEGTSGLTKNTYIRVLSSKEESLSTKVKDLGPLKEMLSSFYPELLPLYRQGPIDLSLMLAYSSWELRVPSHLKRDLFLQLLEEKSSPSYDKYLDVQRALKDLLKHLLEREYQKVLLLLQTMVDEAVEERGLTPLIIDSMELRDPVQGVRALIGERFSLLVKKALLKYLFHSIEGSSKGELVLVEKELEMVEGANEEEITQKMAKELLRLQLALSSLKEIKRPKSAKEWEDLYGEGLSSLELYLARMGRWSNQLMMPGELPLELKREETLRILKKWQDHFVEWYRREEGDLPSLSELLLVKRPKLLKGLNSFSKLFLLDGLRLDVWMKIKVQLLKTLPLRLIQEGTHFALSPVNTSTQLEELYLAGYQGEVLSREHDDLPEDNETIFKVNYIDDLVHSFKEDYASFVGEVLRSTKRKLLPLIEKVPSSTALFIFGDHGFRINHYNQDDEKGDLPPYLHDGESPFEVIVPWALFYKY